MLLVCVMVDDSISAKMGIDVSLLSALTSIRFNQ